MGNRYSSFSPAHPKVRKAIRQGDRLRKSLPNGEKVVTTDAGLVVEATPRYVEVDGSRSMRGRYKSFEQLYDIMEYDVLGPKGEIYQEDSPFWPHFSRVTELLIKNISELEDWEMEPTYHAANVKAQLIKMGEKNEELRPHIRNVLDEMTSKNAARVTTIDEMIKRLEAFKDDLDRMDWPTEWRDVSDDDTSDHQPGAATKRVGEDMEKATYKLYDRIEKNLKYLKSVRDGKIAV